MGPFDYLNSVSYSKQNIWTEDSPTEYVPFLVNRGLSFFIDCIMAANEMNMLATSLDSKLQYEYYLKTLSPYRRYSGKWGTKENQENTKVISDVLQVNMSKARAIAGLLTEDQLKLFHTAKGGLEKNANLNGRSSTN